MANIPMDLLRAFVSVADLGGFSKAAVGLGRSQPAVSLQIRRLEEIAGARLLHRNGRRIEMTEEGELLATYARQILFLNDEAMSRLRKPKLGGTVRVGLPNDFAVSFLPEILGEFAKLHLGVSLEVTCRISKDLLAGLQDREFDVVIAMTGSEPSKTATKAWTERLAWVAGADCEAHRADPIPIIVYPQGCTYRSRIVQSLNRAGRAWRVVYSSPSISGIIAAVRAGLGVTVLSEQTVPEGLRILTGRDGLPGLADVEVGLYCKRQGLSEAAVRLVNFTIASLDRGHAAARLVQPAAPLPVTSG